MRTPELPAMATSGSAERGRHIRRHPDTNRRYCQPIIAGGQSSGGLDRRIESSQDETPKYWIPEARERLGR